MEEMGIMKEDVGYADWGNIIMTAKKKDILGVCLDPSHLRRVLKDTKQELGTLSNSKICSTVDAKKGS